MELHPLQTARLRLEPLTMETARAILSGDLSGLAAAGLTAADGWPHEDTADGLAMAVKTGHPPGWLVTVGGTVIGDIGRSEERRVGKERKSPCRPIHRKKE